jgi:phage N-6-adenine-methyltransferase
VLKRLADENYTPKEVIEMVRSVMGGIDLDPTSTPKANDVVGAAKFYTIDDDAMKQSWAGRVFMNPPYSCSGRFVRKLVNEYAKKSVTEAIVLLNAYTDTSWFHLLADSSSVICLTRGRLGFWKTDPDNIVGRNRMPVVLAYPCRGLAVQHRTALGSTATLLFGFQRTDFHGIYTHICTVASRE